MSAPSRARRGFTLIELLVAAMLLAILAAIALPSFREQLARARRADAQAALLEDAAYMQRYHAANNAYAGTPAPALTRAVVPRDGAVAYRIAVGPSADGSSGYVLTATRAGAMAGDRCGDLTYDELGRKGLVAGTHDAGLAPADCWR
jgi:type IV pilus assembly protein PilE